MAGKKDQQEKRTLQIQMNVIVCIVKDNTFQPQGSNIVLLANSVITDSNRWNSLKPDN